MGRFKNPFLLAENVKSHLLPHQTRERTPYKQTDKHMKKEKKWGGGLLSYKIWA
jgi:hypothetical protein